MSVKKRNYYMGGKKHTVELKYDGYMYTVISDGVLFKQTPNKLFAVQAFNEVQENGRNKNESIKGRCSTQYA